MNALIKPVLFRALGIQYRQASAVPNLYLTFDDGPTRHSARMLELLAKYSVPATFFILGKRISGNEDILREISSAGHSIGNHSFSHVDANKLRYTALRDDLDRCTLTIRNVLPEWRQRLLRPPFGHLTAGYVYHAFVNRAAIIMWSLDSFDYRASSGAAVSSALEAMRSGDIILFHDEFSTTLNALSEIIPRYIDQGYKFGKL